MVFGPGAGTCDEDGACEADGSSMSSTSMVVDLLLAKSIGNVLCLGLSCGICDGVNSSGELGSIGLPDGSVGD